MNLSRSSWIVCAACLSAALLFSCNKPTDDRVAEQIEAGALVIDVRTPAEFQAGHFPGARNIPVSEIESRLSELGAKDAAIVLYCKAGTRAERARGILAQAGFQSVTNAGGLRDMPSAEVAD